MFNEIAGLASIFGFALQIKDIIQKHPNVDPKTAAAMAFVKGLSIKVDQWKKLHVSYHTISHPINILGFLISEKDGINLRQIPAGSIARDTLNNFFSSQPTLYHSLRKIESTHRTFFTQIDTDINALTESDENEQRDYSEFFEERKFDIDEYRDALIGCKEAHEKVCECFKFIKSVLSEKDGWNKEKRQILIESYRSVLLTEFNTIIDNIDTILVWYIDCYIYVTKKM